MKAYVIDQNQLKQYIFIAIAALVLSFAFGYIVGGGQNGTFQEEPKTTINTAVTDTHSELAMKKDANALSGKAEKKIVQKDLKKPKSEKKKTETKKSIKKDKTVVKKTSTNKSASKPSTTEKKKTVVQKKTVEKEKKSASTKPKVAAVNAATTEDKSTSAKAESSDSLIQDKGQVDDKRSYSIQAGMFASKNNAESFIEKLSVEKFDAYVSDFVSTSGAVKYNVRVGRFEERNKAREKLKEYQKFFSTPAYVVISQ